MKKTRTSHIAMVLLAVCFSGCTDGQQKPYRLFWRTDDSAAPATSTGGNTTDTAKASTDQADKTNEPNESVDPRVKNYVGRFPPNDADRENVKRSGDSISNTSPSATIEQNQPNAVAERPSDGQPITNVTGTPVRANAVKAAPSSSIVEQRNADSLYRPPMLGASNMSDFSATRNNTTTPPANSSTETIAASPQLPALAIELTDVRPAPMRPVTVESAQPEAVPNVAAQPAPTDPISTMVRELEQAVKENPQQIDDQIKLRLWYLFSGADEKACAAITDTDPLQGELLTAVFRMMSKTRNMCTNPQASSAETLAAVDELRRVLSQQTPVSIPRIALVTRVRSFGDYDAVEPPGFTAGAGVHVYLYTEIDNFRYEPTDGGKLRSTMSEEVQIYDAQGKIVWQQKAPDITETVLHPRRDFFIPFEIRMPANTPTGQYTLKVTIEDKIGATTDQKRLTFTIGEKATP